MIFQKHSHGPLMIKMCKRVQSMLVLIQWILVLKRSSTHDHGLSQIEVV